MKEIYKDIKGYEKLYQVSNIGNVKSLYKNRLLKPSIENGYLYVILYKDKQPTHKRIHRLVTETFIDNPKNLPQVNHKDEDKLNNNVNNLEWCDNRYNVMYGTALTRAKESRSTSIKKQSKAVQCVETGIIYPSIMEAERRTKIYHGYIIHVLKGRQKTAGGYHWKYVERKGE